MSMFQNVQLRCNRCSGDGGLFAPQTRDIPGGLFAPQTPQGYFWPKEGSGH